MGQLCYFSIEILKDQRFPVRPESFLNDLAFEVVLTGRERINHSDLDLSKWINLDWMRLFVLTLADQNKL